MTMTKKLTAGDITDRSQLLDDTQTLYEDLAYLANPKMPCRECGGSGQVDGGIFSSVCPMCEGARVRDVPGSDPFPMPDFATMRKAIGGYGDALALGEATPDANTVPTLAEIQALYDAGKAQAKQLTAGGSAPGAYDPKLLKAPKKPSGMMSDGDLGDIPDAELAELEKDAT
jgi:hypothetical protein